MDDYRSKMEPEVLQSNFHSDGDMAAVSIAISLKRIADTIGQPSAKGETIADGINCIAEVIWNGSK